MTDDLTLFPAPPREPDGEAHAILARAIEEFDPSHVFAMFSGGHDSLCAAHIASQHPRFSGVVHIATGIGIAETRRFAYDTAKSRGWPFLVYRPKKGNRYHERVLQNGFPGPYMHTQMYNRLKERSIERLIREHKTHRHDRIVLVTGVRRQESARRRMGHIVPVQQQGVRVWVAPLVDWSAAEKLAYMERHALPRNPVTDLLCMSGECLCGAFAKPNELEEIGTWFPRAAAEIRALEEQARDAGVHCVWGTKPPETPKVDPAQLNLEDGLAADEGGVPMLCTSCAAKHEWAQDAREAA